MKRRHLAALLAALLTGAALPASAHDAKLGALRIDHPYALPSAAGASTGMAYLRSLGNTGDQPDRLVGASTPAAGAVEIHHSMRDARKVLHMHAVDAVELPPRTTLQLRHGGDYHLVLVDLKAPLKTGDRFPLTLRFEKAGTREVTVWVQQPRDAAGPQAHRH